MKKAALLTALAVLALVQVSLYWNVHLFNAAVDSTAGPADRAERLKRAATFNPWNDKVYLELGKAYFDQGSESLGDEKVRDAAFGRSLQSFLAALRLNPCQAATHFQLAQTLQFLTYSALPAPIPFFDEYKKAALLTGHNTQIYYEVGRVLLSRWESMRAEEKEFAEDILKKMLAGKDAEKFSALLEVWYLHGHDYAVIERILPDDAGMYRIYADYLGEKSLSIEVREKALSKGEWLDFVKAKNDLDQAQRDYEYFQSDGVGDRLSACLVTLLSLRFSQNLAHQELIDLKDYAETLKTVYRLLAENEIDRTRNLSDPQGYAQSYLALEDQAMAVGEFEQFIRERGLLGEDGSTAGLSKDLQTMAFELTLDFKQNRYKDITKAGGLLETSTLIIPPAGRIFYVRILKLVGDSFLKLDFLYDAEKFFRKALALEPNDLGSLLRILRCYERLNDDQRRKETRQAIEGILTPEEFDLGRRSLEKGHTYSVSLNCDGQPATFRVDFNAAEEGRSPLLTAVFNDRVVWDGYSAGGSFSFSATPTTGENRLILTAVNEPVTLLKVVRTPPKPE